MPSIPGSVPITGFVAPTDDADTYPSHSEEYGKGGYRSVATVTDRDAIPSARRKAGMVVKVLANKMEYVLGAGLGNGNWEANPTGSMELGAYSELEALNGSQLVDGSTFFCRYRESQTYGGSGHFYFSSSSTVTADGAMVLAPSDNVGRFFRFWNGEPVNPIWFGAKSTVGHRDGTGPLIDPGIDNAVPINAAILWSREPSYGPADWGGTVELPPGDWDHSTTIHLQPRVNFVATGTQFGPEYRSHRDPRGMASGRSRLWLKAGSNVHQMDCDTSHATVNNLTYDDDAISVNYTVTISVASPAVFTTTIPHGLVAGQPIYLYTSGSLPTGLTAGGAYYVLAAGLTTTQFQVSSILVNSAVGGGVAINTSGTQSGVHTITKGATARRQMGVTVRGIQFNGNGANQTENNCDGIRLIGLWNVNIENCGFADHRGYLMFIREVNGVNVTACNFYGSYSMSTKGIFNYSCADFKLVDSEGGGAIGPILWVSGPQAWQCFYHQNFLFNAVVRQYTVSSFSGQEITTSTDHVYSAGSPIEFRKGTGSTLPNMSVPPFIRGGTLTIGLKYVITERSSSDFTTVGASANSVGTIFTATGTGVGLLNDSNTVKNMQALTETRSYWAVKTATNKLKVCYNYFDALSGVDAEYFEGGSGTYYIHHGMANGIYVTGGHDLSILGNRTEQNMEHGIALNGSDGNSITGNIANTNQHDTETGSGASNDAAGVYLKNGSSDNVIVGNVFSDWDPVAGSVYPQKYGVWIDASNGRNYLGQNSYRANASMIPTLINATGNTTLEQPVVQTATSTLINSPTTIHTPNITSALTLSRDDTSKSWDFQVSSDILRIRNVTAGYTGLDIQSSSSAMSLILGLGGSVLAPRGTFIYGEFPNGAVGTDVAGANMTFASSPGTGSSTTGGDFVFGTPNASASGGTVQSNTSKVIIKREGQLQLFSRTAAPTVGVTDGQIYYDTTLVGLQQRHAGNWMRIGEPNNVGVSKITADASATFTFTTLTAKSYQILTAAITANRTVTLSAVGAVDGTRAKFTRASSSTGAFNWDIGGLKNLAVGQWCEVDWDGAAWALTQFGSL